MKPTLCSRCKKNLAVIFITKIDGGKTVNEGLCLKCAKEMGIKPVDDMIERMGLSEDDLENLNGEMTEAMNGLEGLLGQSRDRHIFGTVKVGEKGQIVIPKEARTVFGIQPGDTLLVLGDETRGIVVTRPEVMRDVAAKIFDESDE